MITHHAPKKTEVVFSSCRVRPVVCGFGLDQVSCTTIRISIMRLGEMKVVVVARIYSWIIPSLSYAGTRKSKSFLPAWIDSRRGGERERGAQSNTKAYMLIPLHYTPFIPLEIKMMADTKVNPGFFVFTSQTRGAPLYNIIYFRGRQQLFLPLNRRQNLQWVPLFVRNTAHLVPRVQPFILAFLFTKKKM